MFKTHKNWSIHFPLGYPTCQLITGCIPLCAQGHDYCCYLSKETVKATQSNVLSRRNVTTTKCFHEKKVKTHYLVKTKAAKRNTGWLGSFSKLENWEPGMQKDHYIKNQIIIRVQQNEHWYRSHTRKKKKLKVSKESHHSFIIHCCIAVCRLKV